MADKTVSIGVNNDKNLKLTLRHVTEVKPKEELSADSTPTFDGPVTTGTDKPSYTVDISKLDLATMADYALFKKILKALRNNYGTISVSEVVRPKGDGAYRVTEHYNNILLSSNDYTIDAEDLTARDLSFIAQSRTDKDPVKL